MQNLSGKAALVTGGSRGIGAACVRNLAAQGVAVAFTYLSAGERAQALVAEIEGAGGRCLAIRADSADRDEIVAAVEQAADAFGRLDILVNNAGIFPNGPVEDVTHEELERTLGIHVSGVFVASQAALKVMGRGGRIISIGTCFAQRVPFPGITLYAMSKSALIGFTKGLAHDVGSRGITVNVIDPGSTDTDMNPANSDGADGQRALLPVGHYADADDIAATVLHLAGDTGRFITGASIAVDGGFAA